jgi:hypothetical protein
MSRHSIVAVVALSFVVSSCSGLSPSEPSAVVVAPPPAEQPEEIRVPPDWSQSESAVPIDVCKIPDGRPASMTTKPPGVASLGAVGLANVGFPLSPDIIPAKGLGNIVVVPVTFRDLGKNPVDPMEVLAPQLEKIVEWSEFWSQGTFRYEFQVVETWQELPADSFDYELTSGGLQQRKVATELRLANDIVAAVGNQVDWNAAQGLYVYFPPTIESINEEWGGRGSEWIRTPAGDKQLFFRGGGRWHNTDGGGLPAELKREYLWSYWIHEMLHSQGVMLHAPGNGFATGLGQNQYPNPTKFSAAIDAWEAFLLGWIKDDQVLCIDGREPGSESLAMVTPQEIYGGERKIVVIRTGEHDGIVIESRRPIGYSERWAFEDSGLLVYALNLRVMNDRSGESTGLDCGNNPDYDKWAYYLPPNENGGLKDSCFFSDFIVHEGEYVSHNGVRIELEFSDEDLDYVRIASKPN